MRTTLVRTLGLALVLAVTLPGHPAQAQSPDLEALARNLAESSTDMKAFARRTLLPIVLRDLQIRSALNDFDHHAHRLAESIGAPDANPAVIDKMFSNLEMWGGTVDYHLNEASSANRYQKVRTRWAQTVAVWTTLRDAAGQKAPQADPRATAFSALHAGF